ncbi:hypothetical protein ACTXT7_003518 [Hymenolepis weldensis]
MKWVQFRQHYQVLVCADVAVVNMHVDEQQHWLILNEHSSSKWHQDALCLPKLSGIHICPFLRRWRSIVHWVAVRWCVPNEQNSQPHWLSFANKEVGECEFPTGKAL